MYKILKIVQNLLNHEKQTKVAKVIKIIIN